MLFLFPAGFVFGARFWTPGFPDPPQSGYWDDPVNWSGGVLPQHGDEVSIIDLGDPSWPSVTVTYRNTYAPTALFDKLMLGTTYCELEFVLQSDVYFDAVEIDDVVLFNHSAGTLSCGPVSIGGTWQDIDYPSTYRLSGTAALINYPDAISNGTSVLQIGNGGLFDHRNGTVVVGMIDLIGSGTYNHLSGSITAKILDLNGRSGVSQPEFWQTGGVSTFDEIRLGGEDDSTMRLSGGLINVIKGLEVGVFTEQNPPPVNPGATAHFNILGLGTLDINHPGFQAGLAVGVDFPGAMHQSGSSSVEVDHILYVGNTAPGTYTLDSGSLQGSNIIVGHKAPGEFIQNGGAVTLSSNSNLYGYLSVGDRSFSNNAAIYRLNDGTLSTVLSEVTDRFIQQNGTHLCSTGLALFAGGTYTLSNGVINTALLAVADIATFNHEGGSLTDARFLLESGGTFNQGTGIHHQTDGNAEFRGAGTALDMGAGATHTITGGLLLDQIDFHLDRGAITAGSLTCYNSVTLDQDGGDLVILGESDFNQSDTWYLRSGSVFALDTLYMGKAVLPTGSSFQQSGGVYSGRGFNFNTGSSIILSGGVTYCWEDGYLTGSALQLLPAGNLELRDLFLGSEVLAAGRPSGTMSQSGGELVARDLTLVSASTATLQGGTVAMSNLTCRGSSSFSQSGGTLDIYGEALFSTTSSVAFLEGTSAISSLTCGEDSRFMLSNGTVNVYGNVVLDQGASAPMALHAGTLTLGGDFDYSGLGNLGGGRALLLMDGTAALSGGGDFLVRLKGGVIQSGAASVQVAGAHVLAPGIGDDVYESSAAGTSLSCGSAIVGGLGRAQLYVGGQHTVDGLLEVGSAATNLLNHYTLSGSGTLQAGELRVGSAPGSAGQFTSYGGSATVPGGVTLGDGAAASGILKVSSGTFTAATLTVGGSGHGSVNHINGTINCSGTLAVCDGSDYTFTSGTLAAGLLDIDGTLDIAGSGTPRLRARVDNAGTLTLARSTITDVNALGHCNTGTIELQSSAEWSFYSGNSLTNQPAGLICGVGTIGATGFQFRNQGTLSPGTLAGQLYGTLTIRGVLMQTEDALLNMNIGGTATSLKDKLVISSGSAALSGRLKVAFDGGFTPTTGQSFLLISGSSLSANFSDILVTGLPDELGYTITATSSSYTLNVVTRPLAPADITATPDSASAIRIDWTDTNAGITSHRIGVATGPAGPWSESDTTDPGTVTFLKTGLPAGTPHWFYVQAFSGSVTSDWSLVSSASTWTGLEAWRFDNFGTIDNAGDAADDADPLGDSIPNLEKYALGLDPLLDTKGHPNLSRPVFVNVAGSPSPHFGIEFRTPDPIPGNVTIDALASDDLGTWSDSPVPHLMDNPQPGIIRHIWRIQEPVTNQPVQFLKLRFQTPRP